MYDIYDALKSGQTPEELAQKFVEELNAALQKQEADKAAAKAAAQAEAQKAKDTEALTDHFNNYLKMYYPAADQLTPDEIINTIEGALTFKETLAEVLNEAPDNAEFDDVITRFFEKFDI